MSIANGARRVEDVTEFLRERRARREPLLLKIEDKEYELPAGLPAQFVIGILVYQREHGADADVPPDMVFDMLTQIFGEDRLLEIIEYHDLQLDELMGLFERVMRRYGGAPAGPAGNGQASASTSSITGG